MPMKRPAAKSRPMKAVPKAAKSRPMKAVPKIAMKKKITKVTVPDDYRVFSAPGKGGSDINPKTTAVIFVEFQNEFCTPGGKLHDAVKETMAASGMLENAAGVAKAVRAAGAKVIHAPITFRPDGADNPNKNLGILAGCHKDQLFTIGSWNADICEQMSPEADDIVVVGKKGLSAFPGTDLEDQLRQHGIETVALGGFMANCCVESTMREACEKGFNVITLTDCVATTSTEGLKAATEGTYTFFSQPMTAEAFKAKLTPAQV
mmetsp:Transcript_40458/g.72718  ORF Transcript_40458/g.72718 Transcript_40458/m.72718 type:complete len:262 (+) Transcript_40458:63-848(+)